MDTDRQHRENWRSVRGHLATGIGRLPIVVFCAVTMAFALVSLHQTDPALVQSLAADLTVAVVFGTQVDALGLLLVFAMTWAVVPLVKAVVVSVRLVRGVGNVR